MNPAFQSVVEATLFSQNLEKAYHKKVIAGAVLILLPSIYPAAPATIHPTARPTMILIFFRNGDPKSSVRIMLTKDRKPRPMNSGEPHLLTDRQTK